MAARLQEKYNSEVRAKLQEEFSFSNPMQLPRLTKVVVNMGLGRDVATNKNTKVLDSAQEELASITGQKAVVTRARRSIAGFKLREGMPIGVCVTLRAQSMWEFVDRLCSVALPRVRDFRGVSPKAFDGRGNYTLGIREQIIFPEIDYDKIDKIKGMNVTFVTTASSDEEGRALLRHLGMPFRK
jgi:large subunit ribosomal protein L5